MSDPFAGRLPPHSKAAEHALIGSVFRDPAVFDDVAAIVSAGDFYHDHAGRIWSAMADLARTGEPIDVITVHERLKAAGRLDDVGGVPFLTELWDAAPTAANAEYYAKTVRDKAVYRQLIHTCTTVVRDAYHEAEPPDELLAAAERAVLAIGDRGRNTAMVRLDSAVSDAVDRAEAKANGADPTPWVPTGFHALDQYVKLRPGSLTILAARPSVGKTAFLGSLMVSAAANGVPALVFSLEMSRDEIADRVLCGRASVPLHKVTAGTVDEGELQKLRAARGRPADAAVYVDDRPDQSPGSIAAAVRRLVRQKRVGLVLIDYLQLIRHAKAERHHLQVGATTKALKLLARQCGVPFVLLCQLNREVEDRPDGKPRLSDLRDSGEIEQDADIVLLLHPERHEPRSARQRINVIIGKQRNGPKGTVELDYVRPYVRFEEPALL
ncbi:MAG: replicative DNA helicase [Gemmataceae bacterium]